MKLLQSQACFPLKRPEAGPSGPCTPRPDLHGGVTRRRDPATPGAATPQWGEEDRLGRWAREEVGLAERGPCSPRLRLPPPPWLARRLMSEAGDPGPTFPGLGPLRGHGCADHGGQRGFLHREVNGLLQLRGGSFQTRGCGALSQRVSEAGTVLPFHLSKVKGQQEPEKSDLFPAGSQQPRPG